MLHKDIGEKKILFSMKQKHHKAKNKNLLEKLNKSVSFVLLNIPASAVSCLQFSQQILYIKF